MTEGSSPWERGETWDEMKRALEKEDRMNYEDKQEAKRDRMRDRATRLDTEAKRRGDSAENMARAMNGQPILVGHHSEKRHRRDIERMDANMRKAVEMSSEAAELRRRADAVGGGGISSDDENAVTKLHGRIEKKEHDRDRMKKINTLYRKRDAAGLLALNSGFTLEHFDTKLADAYSWEKAPFPKWQVSNLTASIRSDKKRLVELEAVEERREEAITVLVSAGIADGVRFEVIEDREDNRLVFDFESKPSRRALDLLKRHAWKWSPTRGTHVRKLSYAARTTAEWVTEQLVLKRIEEA